LEVGYFAFGDIIVKDCHKTCADSTVETKLMAMQDSALAEPLLDPNVTPSSHEESSQGTPDEAVVSAESPCRNPASPSAEGGDDPQVDPSTGRDPWKNHNVRLSLVMCACFGVADSIWGSVVLSGFLYALGGAMGQASRDNTLVGTAEAVEGLTQLLTAVPIGMVADKFGKAKVVRAGGVLMFATIGITVWALMIVKEDAEESTEAAKQSYYILVAALGLWGIVNGISYGPSQALFSDSIPKGRRSELLTYLYSCYLLSSTIGPIVGIVLLLTVSKNQDDWSLKEIFPVFLVGVCLEIPAAGLMFFFDDKHAVPENEEDEAVPRTPLTATEGFPSDTVADVREEAEVEVPRNLSKKIVPYVLFLSSLIVSLGSGASVKYFPLFFKELGLGSAAVQGIFLVVPISISGLSFVSQSISKHLGRVETTVLFNMAGVSLLFFMTWLSNRVEQGDSKRIGIIVVVYLIRTGIMNCTYPLLESILMDSVKSNERAMWKGLESISSFGWTGSALIGGVLSDKHSYQFTFAITAIMQLVGGLMLLFIRPFVDPETESSDTSEACESQSASLVYTDEVTDQDNANGSLPEPLLSSL
jgi:MFS family permease